MKVLLNLMLAMLLVSPAIALAHGGETHEESKETAVAIAQLETSDGVVPSGKSETTSSQVTRIANHDAASQASGSVLKNLHPATVHFPIALFVMAAITELFAMRASASAGMETAVRVMIYGGATGAVTAAIFGWIHTGLWFGGEAAMQWHRWMGTGLAISGVATAFLAFRQADNRTALRIAVFTIALIIPVQGYLGGELAHGPHHLGL
ncbi:MAG: DUF2231 domain-containing protein [Pontixanthobacter sp.]